MRTLLVALALLLGAAFLAACGGAEGEEPDTPTGTPTIAPTGVASVTGTPETTASPHATASPAATPSPKATASPSPEPTQVEPITCVFPTDTKSFRLTMTMDETSVGTGYGIPFGTFGGRHSFPKPPEGPQTTTMQFEFVAPDSYSEVVTYDGEESCSCIVISSQTWCRGVDSSGWTEQAASEELSLFSPEDVCTSIEDFPASLFEQEGEKETVNGIAVIHYRLVEDPTVDKMPAEDYFLPIALGESSFEVWLAEDGNWPVRMVIEIDYNGGPFGQYSLDTFWEIRDLDDPSIVIEPPTLR